MTCALIMPLARLWFYVTGLSESWMLCWADQWGLEATKAGKVTYLTCSASR